LAGLGFRGLALMVAFQKGLGFIPGWSALLILPSFHHLL
jgi:hypothetical protein